MIGKKDIALINTGRKLVSKYKDNFSKFTDHDFYTRIYLVDNETGLFVKTIEMITNATELADYLDSGAVDLGNYKVDKIEFSTSGR